jgi:bla regulator protein blaR1
MAMNPNSFSAIWSTVWPALGDHLWQSTLFLVAAGLLTLILRKNHARARCWLWLTASVKFLIPFSWLTGIGSHLSWWRNSAETNAGLYAIVEQIGRPFSQPAKSVASPVSPIVSPSLTHLFPALLIVVWLCGFLAVLLLWLVRWRRISAALRDSVPLREGREVEVLRRQERVAGINQRVEMLLSCATLEPGIFGMTRPVLLWPKGISQHLEDAHLEAILAHELWHVRRRDNLAAALHMLVESLFWFHPLVWWLGSRLVDERERACDEEVVELVPERHIYAESILKVCEFCVGSPLACVSGVTGADLKKRMVHIMSEHVARKLDFSRKLLLTVAALAAIAVPIIFGLVNATPSRAQSQDEAAAATTPAFESFSIKPSSVQPSQVSTPTASGAVNSKHMSQMMYGPDGFVANNVTLRSLIQEAYGIQANQISGPSDLLDSATYDVTAKADPASGIKFGPGADGSRGQLALQAALAEHAGLVVSHETKVLPVDALVVAEGGPKLQPSQSPDEGDRVKTGMRMLLKGGGQDSVVEAQGITTADLARQLSLQLSLPVLDKTGLSGHYNFNLHWSQNPNPPSDATETDAANASSASPEPALLTALQQQLGLKLEPQKQPMDVLVIEHLNKPNEN